MSDYTMFDDLMWEQLDYHRDEQLRERELRRKLRPYIDGINRALSLIEQIDAINSKDETDGE